MKTKRFLCILLVAVLLAACAACNTTRAGYDESLRINDDRDLSPNEYTVLNLSSTDDYGRKVSTADSKKDKYVGMFFFLTLGQHAGHDGHYDISKITQYGTKYENFQENSARSPLGSAHFWGEPVWGYYNSEDPWVMRKQIEMLTMAGIDFIVFDTTNAVLYQNVVDVLLEIMEEYRLKGWNVPKFMYYLGNNNNYKSDLKFLYDKFYKEGEERYKELWFAPEGKPFITKPDFVAFDEDDPIENAIGETFIFKHVFWPDSLPDDNGLSWMEWQYDAVSGKGQPRHGDWISVSIAQHPTVRFSDTVGSWGRGYNFETGENDHSRFREGLNFQSQWDAAIGYGDKVKYIFQTGWNEWVAGKLYDGNVYFTVDQFDEEYSRDIEPCRNGYGDNFYLQSIMNSRRANYTEAKHYIYPKKSIDITDFENGEPWKDASVFLDFTGECIRRDFKPMCVTLDNYVNETNRNDIAKVSVLRDSQNIYFRVETADDITAYQNGDESWMNLLIRTQNGGNLYYGYDYVINTQPKADGTTNILKAGKNNSLKNNGTAKYAVDKNVLMLQIPLKNLGLSATNYEIQFKVTDNVGGYEDYLNLYDTGDSAPIGRLNYTFGY
ncbi:hypothetical protein ESZ91_03955 [Candidatus Borkfalkia ceftriaxoniphila]|uniref:Uncharacterized protein n=1 Tax=Candidatus Borkfalkia ceftriaxoniphila TaxID=2508949 RepID=A0A4Q2KAH0_9FIRM|nr:hypothetical protein [Candidatus Borkfalkia ceftriaxoniphila]RXZ61555.1 hypothetical protein ESZ91_03955 [Candidatus Borkfalkia ceftriaxoniphila]